MIKKWGLLSLFAMIVSGRGIMIKILHLTGVGLPEILFFGGFISVVFTLVFQIITKQAIHSLHILKLQTIRFVVSFIFWPLAFYSFIKLDVSVVNTISKLTIPIFILLGTYLGVIYSKKEKNYALISIIFLLVFFVIQYSQKPNFVGYAIFILSIVVVMIETFLLRNACKLYSVFDVVFIPSIACCFSGLALLQFNQIDYSIILNLGVESYGLIFIFSIFFFLYYVSSIYKYDIFPLGVSEYPLLLAVYPVLLWEYFFMEHKPDFISLSLIISITLLLARCVKTKHEATQCIETIQEIKFVGAQN
ncbi:hypothetical protein [Legionella anisa]|uniref:hypothetical protein n=1 Tax=Legionella anisa TaxID=28082 RepID=UPI0010412230|nr:hypothetical protein [Legionella anisa]